VGSNPTEGIDACLLWVLCVVRVEVSATDWSLVHRSTTHCGASLCVIKKPHENEEAKSPLPGCENTTIMGCNGGKTNKQTNSPCFCLIFNFFTSKIYLFIFVPYWTFWNSVILTSGRNVPFVLQFIISSEGISTPITWLSVWIHLTTCRCTQQAARGGSAGTCSWIFNFVTRRRRVIGSITLFSCPQRIWYTDYALNFK
jgi:hypothetical protein